MERKPTSSDCKSKIKTFVVDIPLLDASRPKGGRVKLLLQRLSRMSPLALNSVPNQTPWWV